MLGLFLLLIEGEEDKNKFEHIYRKYSNDMYKLALKNTENERDAEEIVSEAFLSVLSNIKIIKTDNETALRAYLFKTLKNKYYDRLKKEKNAALNIEDFNDVSDGEDIEISITEKEEKEIILKTILKMPDTYRYILYFKYCEDYSTGNIAKMLDMSENTVRKKLKEGVQYIIKALHGVEKNGKL